MIKNNFWHNKKVVITGSSGFIGQAIVKNLEKKRSKIIPISRRKGVDLLDLKTVKKITKGADLIINCAAIDGNSEFKKNHSSLILDTNIKIASNVLNIAASNNIKNLVFLSSAEIYPTNIESPFSEKNDYTKNPEHTENGYVLSKRITEILAEQFSKEHGLQTLLLRPTNVYGPNDQNKRVISTLIDNIAKNKKINIWGDGLQKRSFVFVDDLAEIISQLVANNITGKINIASTENVSILELAKLISQLMKKTPIINFDRDKDNQSDRVLNNEKLQSLLDFKFTDLESGLKKTINNYYQEQKQ